MYSARFLSRTGGVIQPPQAEEVEIAAQTTRYRDHVIVCGAGELGLTVSEILRHAGVAHLLLEADAQKVEAARCRRRAGVPWRCQSARYLAGCRLDACALGGANVRPCPASVAHRPGDCRRRPALTLWVSCRSTTAADAFRAMPNVRVYQQSLPQLLGWRNR